MPKETHSGDWNEEEGLLSGCFRSADPFPDRHRAKENSDAKRLRPYAAVLGFLAGVAFLCAAYSYFYGEEYRPPFSYEYFAVSPRSRGEDPPVAEPRPWSVFPAIPANNPTRNLSTDFSCASFGIVTPTYVKHFEFVERFVRSFLQFASDYTSFEHTFVVGSEEEVSMLRTSLRSIVHEFNASLLMDSFMRIVPLDRMLSDLGVTFDEHELHPTASHGVVYPYQSVKKMYGVLYSNCPAALLLDSETIAIRKFSLAEMFREFLEFPYVIISETHTSPFVQQSIEDSLRILGYDETAAPPHYFPFNYNGWFVERHALRHFFATVRFNTGKEFLHNFYEQRFPYAFEWTSYVLHLQMHQDMFPQYHFLSGQSLLHRYIRDPQTASEVVLNIDTHANGGPFEKPGAIFSSSKGSLRTIRALAEFADDFRYRFSRFEDLIAPNRTVAFFAIAPTVAVLCGTHDWTDQHQRCLERFDERVANAPEQLSPKQRWELWVEASGTVCPRFANMDCHPCKRYRKPVPMR